MKIHSQLHFVLVCSFVHVQVTTVDCVELLDADLECKSGLIHKIRQVSVVLFTCPIDFLRFTLLVSTLSQTDLVFLEIPHYVISSLN